MASLLPSDTPVRDKSRPTSHYGRRPLTSSHEIAILHQEMIVKKSDYIKYSHIMVKKLYKSTCFGKGSMYEDNVISGLPDAKIAKQVLNALVKQEI